MKIETTAPEIWDAYYPDGTLAGADLIRGELIPREYRHAVAEIFVIHTDGSVLMMQRDYKKPNYPGYWECGAGGSVLKGESFNDGARRELQEETGIVANNLVELHTTVTHDTIYKGFLCETDAVKESVILQEGETIAYRWVAKEDFLPVFQSEDCVSRVVKRWDYFVHTMFGENSPIEE